MANTEESKAIAEAKALEELDENRLTDFKSLSELNVIEWRYSVMVIFKENQAPVGDMYLSFDKPLTEAKAYEAIINTSIKNWVLNILNSLVQVKWFHTYSDYLVLLWLADWIDKVKEQLAITFDFKLKSISDEEYLAELEARKKEDEAIKKENESVDITEDIKAEDK